MSEDGQPQAVLFACSFNSVRSPMAAALARDLFPNQIYITSAGVRRGEPDPFAVAVMEERGLDVRKHKPRTFEDLEDTGFDLVISLAPEAHHRALELTRYYSLTAEYWPTPDPTITTGSRDQIMDAYRAVRDGLERRIKQRLGWTPPALPQA